jgi:hypothetical protein
VRAEAHKILNFGDAFRFSIWACAEQAVMGGDEEPGRILPVDGQAMDVRLGWEFGNIQGFGSFGSDAVSYGGKGERDGSSHGDLVRSVCLHVKILGKSAGSG